jgi:ATP-binding protein involved in chromosome partitioning
VDCGDEGRPVVLSAPDSVAAAAYRAIASALAEGAAVATALPPGFSFRWTEGEGARAADLSPRPGAAADAPLAVERRDARTLAIRWADGTDQAIDVRDLRLACPCAACVEEMSGRALLDPVDVPLDVAPVSIGGVGNYALAVAFSDGHATGIYTWARLRAMAATVAEEL